MGASDPVFDGIEELARRAPELGAALETALVAMQRQPTTVAERRALEQRLTNIGEAWHGVRDALMDLQRLSKVAAIEQKTTALANAELQRKNKALEAQVAHLLADLEDWRDEYEPDSNDTRPAFFSNIRRALSVFRS